MKKRQKASVVTILLIGAVLSFGVFLGCGQPSLYTIVNGPTGEPLRIDPGSVALFAQSQYKFTAAGGQPPYAYSVLGGGGTVDSGTGVFTAGLSDAECTVRVTDAYGNTEDAEVAITVGGALTISPSSLSITVNGSITFGAFGGVPPYTYSIATAGTGSPAINSSTGDYTAGPSAGTDVVRVTDSAGSTSDSTVSVASAGGVLGIIPNAASIALSGTITFGATGGTPPYVFSAVSLLGGTGENFNAGTATYTAPSDAVGTVTIRVTDNAAATSDATITVSSAYPLAVSPSSATIGYGSSLTFSASGGVPPYTFSTVSLIGGTGESFNAGTGTYTAPSDAAGNATIRVTDGEGTTDDAVITVTGTTGLSISPVTIDLDLGDSIDFNAFGGEPPYAFSLPSSLGGTGENLAGGTYTAPTDTTGNATVRVTDNALATADAAVTVTAASALAVGPASVTLHPGDAITFSGSGGVPPYSYSLITAVGGTGEGVAGSTYTAPSDATGNATVRLSDGDGTTADAAVTVTSYSGLGISPSSISLDYSDTITFEAAGGVPPYTYSLVTAVGGTGENFDAGTRTYTAPSDTTGNGTVRVIDNAGTTADASVTVTAGPALTIHPTSITLTPGDTVQFSASGGVPGYSYTLPVSAGGTGESLVGGAYTAPSDTTGNAAVRVTDGAGTTRDGTITITESSALLINPAAVTLNLGDSILASASGGVPPYTFTLETPIGGAGENLSGQTYTAPSDAVGNAVVRVQDNMGTVQDMTITVTPAASLAIGPPAHSMSLGENVTFAASGGVPPYSYSAPALIGGSGENLTGANYQAPYDASGTATVRVTDNEGALAEATVTVESSVSDVTRAENPLSDEILADETGFDDVGVLVPGALTTINGDLGGGAADFYRIDTGVNTGLWVKLTWAGGDNFDLALYDAGLGRLGESVTSDPGEEEMIWTLAPGTVYYVVADCETYGLSGGPYTISITGVR